MKKTRRILDNDLRLRSFPGTTDDRHAIIRSLFPPVGRFDELTDFFNVINGLFRQSALTLALGTPLLTPLPHLSKINMGLNMNINTSGVEHRPTGLLDNVTLYGLIDRDDDQSIVTTGQRHYLPVGIGRFSSADRSWMLDVNHQWTSSLTSAVRFGTMPDYRLRAQVEYRRPNETGECIAEYILRHSTHLQLSYLSRLWQGNHYRIDGGFNLRVVSITEMARWEIKWTVLRSLLEQCTREIDWHRPSSRSFFGCSGIQMRFHSPLWTLSHWVPTSRE